MKESTKEDLANHFGHESYADDGNVVGVATAVVYAGKLLSSDPHPYRVPTLSVLREGKMFHCDIGKRWNGSAESKNLSMRRNFNRENRETLPASNDGQQPSLERSVNAHGGNADMHAERESDGCVVPAKSANNGEQCFSAESMEGRQPAKRNMEQPNRLAPFVPGTNRRATTFSTRRPSM